MNTENMPLAPTSTLPPICDDLYTAGVESDRCPDGRNGMREAKPTCQRASLCYQGGVPMSNIAALKRYAERFDLDLTPCAPIEDPKRRYHSWLVEALVYGLNDTNTAIKIRCYAQAREYIARLECMGEVPGSVVYDAKTALRCEWEERVRG